MGLTLITAGLFFLLNPSIVIVDIFPDIFGCFLILLGMSRLSLLNASMSDAKANFQKLFAVSFLKIPCALIYIGEANSPNESWGLLFTIGFGFLDVLYGMRAFTSFFDAIEDLANSDERISSDTPSLRRIKEYRALSSIFVWARAILPALPELTTLTSTEYGTVTSNGIVSLANYKTLFTLLAAVIGLIIGIYWFISMVRFLRGIKRDSTVFGIICEKIFSRECELAPVNQIRGILSFLSLSIIGIILTLELKFDGINYLPHALFALVFLTATLSLSKKYTPAKKMVLPSAIYAGVSTLSWGYTLWFIISFFGEYLNDKTEGLAFSVSDVLYSFVRKSFPMLYKYIGMCVFTAADALFFIIFLWVLRSLLSQIIKDHTGGTYAPDGHLIGRSELEATQRSLKINLNVMFALGLLSAISDIAYSVTLPYFPEWWMFDALIRLAFIAVALRLIFALRDCLKDRYDISKFK